MKIVFGKLVYTHPHRDLKDRTRLPVKQVRIRLQYKRVNE